MKRALVGQLELNYVQTEAANSEAKALRQPRLEAVPDAIKRSLPSIQFPNFQGLSSSVVAATARQAGRLNAAHISEAEVNELKEERQRLLDKRFAKTITRPEVNRLEYVRWSLDRIEDARHGIVLDALESYVAYYEEFAQNVAVLQMQLAGAEKRRK